MIGFGQSVPQGINYQAVARDSTGSVLMDQGLTIRFSIISDISTGNISWQETHQDSTNAYGLFTAIIGQGTSTSVGSSATFDVIDWGAYNHFLKVEIDYGGGLVDMGTTAFMSVPYALYTPENNSEKPMCFLSSWNGDESMSYTPPNNTSNPFSGNLSISPPCQGGGELLLFSNISYSSSDIIVSLTNNTFEIPAELGVFHVGPNPPPIDNTYVMNIELSIDIWFGSTGSDRENTILFWLGKNSGAHPAIDGGGTGPMAYRLNTFSPSYFGINSNEPTFSHSANITLLPYQDFDTGDQFYFTAQCVGSPSFPRYKNLRIKVTFEKIQD
tara:strand:- start:1550 stop:2533 length:984 start_codon:yes stop_codon:yes gene_type:complete